MVLEKKVNIKPVNCSVLNQLSKDFGKLFVLQTRLSAEQAFWLKSSPSSEEPSTSSTPVKTNVPKELPKKQVLNENDRLLDLNSSIDMNTFVNVNSSVAMNDSVNYVEKCNKCLELEVKLIKQHTQDIVNIVVNSSVDMNTSVNVNSFVAMNDSVNYVEKCNKCLELKAELIKQYNMVEKYEYNKISKRFFKLEQHCISLELAMQLNKEIFQKTNTSVNQTEPTFDQLFELNNLKANLQARDTTIKNLKANIKRLNKTSTTNSVKKDIDEIETINIELEHRVAKLIAENEHLKQTYEQLYDSIKSSRVRAKKHTKSLVNQLNQKKLKEKDIVDNVAQVSNATIITPGMYKLDPLTLAPKDKNNKEAHIYYLKHTMEQAAILREIVEQAKSLNPLDSVSYSACKYVKLIQEFLGYVRDTCPNIHKPSEKLVAIMPINKKKIVSSMFDARHELCFLEFVFDMNACSKSKSIKKAKKKEEWKPTRKVITTTNEVPLKEPIPLEVVAHKPVETKVFWIVLWYLDSGCSKHMTEDRSQLTNSIHKFLGTVKFGNDHIVNIMVYGDYQIGNVTISRVCYVEGLGHNLFSVGQLCDSDLEVAFGKYTCFVHNLEGVDLLSGTRETNLYTLSIGDMMVSSPICLLSKVSKTKSWLWHQRLSHLNFGDINHLGKNGLVRGKTISSAHGSLWAYACCKYKWEKVHPRHRG
ncbi:integrase, catalytic region, zinc finger, CCHC-type containing protein [Tanacetum coccineum]